MTTIRSAIFRARLADAAARDRRALVAIHHHMRDDVYYVNPQSECAGAG